MLFDGTFKNIHHWNGVYARLNDGTTDYTDTNGVWNTSQEKNVNQPGFGDYLARIEIMICKFDKKNIVASLCYSIKGKIFFFIFKFMLCLEIIMNQKSL